MTAGTDPISVVGLGADGWRGLSPHARQALLDADVVMGSERQLALVPEAGGDHVPWPSPMLPALPTLFAEHDGRSICVLASGDPMVHGIGSTLARILGPERLSVLPHPSSVSLACARMGWPAHETDTVSLVGKPVELIHPAIQPGRRLIVLSSDGDTPDRVASLLVARGYGPSSMTVLENLGDSSEHHHSTTAEQWQQRAEPLNVIALRCRPTTTARRLPRTPGLPDDAFEHDGQVTKRDVRASTLARLAPSPGELLWDVGAGAGSISIEWMRTDPSCRAVAIEHRADRAERVERNAASLGVPGLRVVTGAAPDALDGLDAPDAVFVGGGSTVPGVLDACFDALAPGGRLVVNAVTMESEVVVADRYARLGGELVRIAVDQASPVGGFTGWRPSMRVTQWVVSKP